MTRIRAEQMNRPGQVRTHQPNEICSPDQGTPPGGYEQTGVASTVPRPVPFNSHVAPHVRLTAGPEVGPAYGEQAA